MRAHGFDPKDAILEMQPRDGEYTLREEDILATIANEGQTIALVLFSGVQYYTGQWFPMQSITRKAKEQVNLPAITFRLSLYLRIRLPCIFLE